jgi:hypothetical protein
MLEIDFPVEFKPFVGRFSLEGLDGPNEGLVNDEDRLRSESLTFGLEAELRCE